MCLDIENSSFNYMCQLLKQKSLEETFLLWKKLRLSIALSSNQTQAFKN